MSIMIRIFSLLATLVFLAACAEQNADAPPPDLGHFKLGHNVVIASKMRKGPISRDATEEEWVSTLTDAVDKRFGVLDGDQLYHLGISVEGYMLAPEGVPVLYNPRSMLILNVTVWDDAAAKKLNEKVHQITVLEDSTSKTAFIGSGRVRTKQEQMDGLASNAMDQLGEWLTQQKEEGGWFAAYPGTVVEDTASGESAAATE